jgi:inner membrane protein
MDSADDPRGNFTTLELTPGGTCPDKVPQWGMPRADLLSGAQR